MSDNKLFICLPTTQEKSCTRCKAIKPISEFYHCGTVKSGKASRCRDCQKELNKAWRKENRDYVNEKQRARLRLINPEVRKARKRTEYLKNKLRRKYGLTQDQYESLLRLQNYCCRICRKPFDKTWKNRPCVDHCHSVGHVRSILCACCNTAIGLMDNSVGTAVAAAEYLSRETLFNYGQ